MWEFSGKNVVITGAASGIGRALAEAFVKEGGKVALTDIDQERLDEVVSELNRGGDCARGYRVDNSSEEETKAFSAQVLKDFGHVDVVCANAGVAEGSLFEHSDMDKWRWLMGINFWGVVYGTKEFLPYLRQRPWGHIVNISSMNGFLPNPTNGPYVASKFAVRGYTETLYQELRGSSVSVSVVHPGGIKTNIARNAKLNRPLIAGQTQEEVTRVYEEKMFKTTPEDAAGVIVDGIRKRKLRVLVGKDAKFLWVVNRCFPQGSIRLLNWLYRRMNRR